MSRGKKRPPRGVSEVPAPAPPPRRQDRRNVLVDLAIMLGTFVGAALVAEAAGAANLGTALSFGQIAFTLAAVYVLLRR